MCWRQDCLDYCAVEMCWSGLTGMEGSPSTALMTHAVAAAVVVVDAVAAVVDDAVVHVVWVAHIRWAD